MLTEEFNSVLAALLIARRYVLTNPEQHASVAYAINIIKRLHYETSRAAPQPEPVAYRSSRNNGKTWIITEGDPTDLMPDVGGIVVPLYAAPPAAPAVPLTTEQITQIARKHGIVYTNRHYAESPAVAFSQAGLMAFLAEVGIGGGNG